MDHVCLLDISFRFQPACDALMEGPAAMQSMSHTGNVYVTNTATIHAYLVTASWPSGSKALTEVERVGTCKFGYGRAIGN